MDTTEEKSSIFHYTNFEAALKILETLSLKTTKPSELNDPFECNPHIKSRAEYLEEELNDLIEKNFKENTSLINDFYNTYKNHIPQDPNYAFQLFKTDFYPENIRYQETMDKIIRIISLSKIKNNVPMWAHYADKHKGVVLEFDLTKDPFSSLKQSKWFGEVDYPTNEARVEWDHLKFSLLSEENQTEKSRNVVFTKHRNWEYEKEIRIILPVHDEEQSTYSTYKDGENYFLNFPPEAIKKVYLGINMSDVNKKIISRLIKSRSLQIQIVKLGLSHDKFDFVSL